MNAGTHANAEQLFPLVYEELKRIASRQMRRECPGRTLQTTALVHEAFLKLSKAQNGGTPFESEEHFLRAATCVMQRILVDQARARKRTKRGGGKRPQSITGCEVELAHIDLPDYLPELDEALQSLAKREPIAAELVQMRYFGGLTNSQAAAAIGISARSADRYWVFARAWLYQALRGPATK